MVNNEISLTPVRTAIIKKIQKVASAGKDVEKREALHTVGRNANYYSFYEKQHGDSSKN